MTNSDSSANNTRKVIAGSILLLALYFASSLVVQLVAMVPALVQAMPIGIAGTEAPTFTSLMNAIRTPVLISLILGQFIFMAGGSFFLGKRWHQDPLGPHLKLKKQAWPFIFLGIVGIAGLFPYIMALAFWIDSLVPFSRQLNAAMESLIQAPDVPGQVLSFLAIAITPAICEELFFRAHFQRHLQSGLKGHRAWIIAGCAFAFIHQNYLGLPSLIIAGCYLALLYYLSGSVWPGIFVHFLYNGIQVWASNDPAVGSFIVTPENTVQPWLLIAGAPMAIIAVLVMLYLGRRPQERAPVLEAQ